MKKKIAGIIENNMNRIVSFGKLVPEGWGKQQLRTIYNMYSDRSSVRRVTSLNIIDSGTIDGLAYIMLRDGSTFYGFQSDDTSLRRYKSLDKKTKQNLIPEAYLVADEYYSYNVDPPWDRQRFYQIQSGDTVIDAGSNQGYYTRKLSRLVGTDGTVLAIEPHPDNYQVLKKNAEEAEFDNIILVNKAVSNGTGQIEFYEAATTTGRHHTVEEIDREDITQSTMVERDTIDNLIETNNIDKVDYLTLTVNGHEYDALLGATKLLESGVNLGGPIRPLKKSQNLLESNNYECTNTNDSEFAVPILYASPTLKRET